MEQALRRGRIPAEAAARRPSPPPTRFTPLELAAAEQLIHLSESSCSTGAAFSPRGSASACYSSSSPRSVNAPPAAPARDELAVVDAEEGDDDDEQEVGGRPRRVRRYRSIAEIYAATEPCGSRRRKKAKAGAGAAVEQRRK